MTKKRSVKAGRLSFNDFIYENFVLSLRYLKETKNYLIFSIIVFMLMILIGYFFPIFFEEEVTRLIEEIVGQIEGLGPLEIIGFIIDNNFKSAFFGMVFGVFFAIIPIGVMIVNGYISGFVAGKIVASEGILILWKLLPHGVFEIPAMLISISLGIRLGMFLIPEKNKSKGIIAFIVSFICYLLFLNILSYIISLPVLGEDSKVVEEFYISLLNNPSIVISILIVILLFFVLSVYAGAMTLPKKERKFVAINIRLSLKNSLRVFILIVIPLIVIAGIIEGILIAVLG